LEQLLAYENDMASVDLRLRLGSDGRVRELRPIEIRENSANAYHVTPLGRLLWRLNMLIRGFRFSEDEIVARHLMGVFDSIDEYIVALVHMQYGMEFYLAALALKDRAQQAGLDVCLPSFSKPDATESRSLLGLFNPLLLGVVPKVVAGDLVTQCATCTMIVTGPNSGGKTRLLEAVALAQMLGQSGFFVPAIQAHILPSRGLFVSLIEQAKADQTEGRLGTELVRIRELFEAMRVGDMVILDELCSGTNPSEGEEIFRLVVSLLAELRPQAFISTHFLQLASRLQSDMPVDNLQFCQVELDERQWPTYHFVSGVAKSSLAHITAARLGVTREELQGLVERSKKAAG
jgi:DNA mismatch repair protein MutS2